MCVINNVPKKIYMLCSACESYVYQFNGFATIKNNGKF